MDVLSDVLRAVRLTGAIFFDVHRRAPWVVESPAGSAIADKVMADAQHLISFHVILSGKCWAEIPDTPIPPCQLQAGEIMVVPMADPHVMGSAPRLRAPPDLGVYFRPTDQQLPFLSKIDEGDGEHTRMVCGYLGCDVRPFNPLLQALPRLLHSRAGDGSDWVINLLRLAVDETGCRRPGGETVLSKLAELLFVDVVRRHIDSLPPDAGGWLSGLRDRYVGVALALMHARPAEAWTLDQLAREAGISRSAFADRFTQFVGDTPMHYLTRWRMQLASRLLERPGIGMAQVAAEVGYESEAAFNRAFKKCLGVPPGAWRRCRAPSS